MTSDLSCLGGKKEAGVVAVTESEAVEAEREDVGEERPIEEGGNLCQDHPCSSMSSVSIANANLSWAFAETLMTATLVSVERRGKGATPAWTFMTL